MVLWSFSSLLLVTPNSYFTSQSRRSKICSYLAQFGALNRSARMEWVWESGVGMGGRGAKKSHRQLVPRCCLQQSRLAVIRKQLRT